MDRRSHNSGPPSDLAGPIAGQGQMVPAPYEQSIVSGGMLTPYGPAETKQAARPWTIEKLLRYKWTVLLVSLAVAVPAIAAIWTFTTPTYTAKAEVRVRPIIPRLVFTTEENGMIPLYQSYMNTQVSIMRSPTVLNRVLGQDDVKSTNWYKTPGKSLLKFGVELTEMERLRQDLSVSPRGQTEIIDVSLSAVKGKDAEIIVNAVLDQYLKYVGERSDETSNQLYKQLTGELDSLRSEIEGREKVVSKLAKELGTSTPDELVSKMRVRLDEAEARLETLRQDLKTAQWQEKELAAQFGKPEPAANAAQSHARIREAPAILPASLALSAAMPSSIGSCVAGNLLSGAMCYPLTKPEPAAVNPAQVATSNPATAAPSQPPYEADELWRQLHRDLTMVRAQVQVESKRLMKLHPRNLELKQQVDAAEEMLRNRQQELDVQWKAHPATALAMQSATGTAAGFKMGPDLDLVKELDAVSHRVRLLQYQEPLATESVKAEQTQFSSVFESAQLLTKESELIRHKKGLYDAVRTRVDQKDMERNVPGSIEILTKASAPSEASNDRRLLLSLLALIGGLGAGLAVSFLRASTTQVIHEFDDMTQAAPTPFLGQLPYVRSKTKGPKIPIEDDELLGESIRMVRTALLQRIDLHKGSIVQITSAEPGAGKSTVAAMLARSLAQCGKKVLLVDTDLRNPTFARRFGISAEPGLLGSLTGTSDSEAILGTDIPLLNILPSGRACRSLDAELMANGVLTGCLEQWRSQYDLVLLDSSPLLPVADARILAHKADGSVMVVREKASRRSHVLEALSYLQISGGNLLGVVFIGSGGHGGYPYYSYQYNSDKSSSETKDAHDRPSD